LVPTFARLPAHPRWFGTCAPRNHLNSTARNYIPWICSARTFQERRAWSRLYRSWVWTFGLDWWKTCQEIELVYRSRSAKWVWGVVCVNVAIIAACPIAISSL
jgi:hypothetical protein